MIRCRLGGGVGTHRGSSVGTPDGSLVGNLHAKFLRQRDLATNVFAQALETRHRGVGSMS